MTFGEVFTSSAGSLLKLAKEVSVVVAPEAVIEKEKQVDVEGGNADSEKMAGEYCPLTL